MKMDNPRGQECENYYKHEVKRAISCNKRPHEGSRQCTVPSWEKKFCILIGSVSWPKLLEVKKYIHLYQNVLNWNDSAGEEAFYNAKDRFWAKINSLPCEISLPDPDNYIDEIDWNSDMDPELYLDLERARSIAKQHSEDAFLHDLLLLNQPIIPTGWGDEEEDQGQATNSLPKIIDCDKFASNNDNVWESSCPQNNGASNENGWEICWNDSRGSNKWESNIYDSKKINGGRTNGDCGTWDWNRHGEVDGLHVLRSRTSKLHGNDY